MASSEVLDAKETRLRDLLASYQSVIVAFSGGADSAYLAWLKRLRQAADRHQVRTSGDPKEVAAVIANALEARRPRFRYQVGPFAKLDYFLRGKVPTKLIRRGTTRYLGLPLARW